jgi:hypothetical protein
MNAAGQPTVLVALGSATIATVNRARQAQEHAAHDGGGNLKRTGLLRAETGGQAGAPAMIVG